MVPVRLVTDVPPPGPDPATGPASHLDHRRAPDTARVGDLLVDAAPVAVLLIDPGGVAAGVARGLGIPVLVLPHDPDTAGAVVAVASAWGRSGACPGLRGLEALVSAAAARPAARVAAPGARRVRALARWARTAWIPCPACDGGGVDGAGCARCGHPIRRGAA